MYVFTANMILFITISSIVIIEKFTQAKLEKILIYVKETQFLEILETDQQHYKIVFGGMKEVCTKLTDD